MIFQDYYITPGVRETCHKLKEAENLSEFTSALYAAAQYLADEGNIDSTCFLVPAPQHTGKATYTKELCEALSLMTGATVLDIVRCRPHAPLYIQKQNRDCRQLNAEFYLSGPYPEKGKLLFIDNVIATGATFSKICALFDGKLKPMPYAVDYTRLKDEKILNLLSEQEGKHTVYDPLKDKPNASKKRKSRAR